MDRAGRGAGALVALVATVLLSIALVPAPARARAGAVEASGFMRVTGKGLVQTRLHVAEPAQLSLDYWRDGTPVPTFSKGKGFAAVVLVAADWREGRSYVAARLPQPNGIDQKSVAIGHKLCQLERACDIPAGDYHLYLVSDGKVSVDLQFEGLPGSSRVTLTAPANGELSEATESYFHGSPPGSLEMDAHGAGFSPELTGKSNLLFSTFWFHGPEEGVGPAPADKPLLQVGDAGSCNYDGPPPANAYVPGCPGGHQGSNFSTWRALSNFQFLQWGASTNVGPGEIGEGYFAVHSGIRDPGFVGFWLDIT